MWEWLTKIFIAPSYDERLERIASVLRFSRPVDFYEAGYQVAEASVEKLLQMNKERDSGYVDFNHPDHDSPQKFKAGLRYLEGNQGLMHMPAVFPEGDIYHGRHRMALLDKMGVKVIPVLVSTTTRIPDSFYEKFGVDKPYYAFTPQGASYHEMHQGEKLGGDRVDLYTPIDRAAIMQPPGPYVPPAPAENPPSEPPGTEHRDRARDNIERRSKPGADEGRF